MIARQRRTQRRVSIRVNDPQVAYASLARVASPAIEIITNPGYRGVVVVIDVTASADTPSVVFNVEGLDHVSGKAWLLLASAAITGTGTTVLRIYPGLTAAANLVASDVVPGAWRIRPVHADGDSITYSVGYSPVE